MKKFISASGTIFCNFFQILIRMEAVFRSSEIYFLTNPLFGQWKNDFGKLEDFVLLIRAFFCWWTVYLKLGVNQFFRSFHFVTVEAVFLASGNRFLIDYFITASGNGFYGQCFFYSEQTLCWLFELR